MTIRKHYEIICNSCGQADYWIGSIKGTERHMLEVGWIKKGNKHYCDKKCHDKSTHSVEEGSG